MEHISYDTLYYQVVSDFLTTKRKENNYKIKDVATLIKLPLTTYYNYETGKRLVSPSAFIDLCNLYGLDCGTTFKQLSVETQLRLNRIQKGEKNEV